MCDNEKTADINEKLNQTQIIKHDLDTQKLYLDIIKNEYNIENNRKQSLETRAGLILAFLATLATFLFDKIELNSLFNAMTTIQPFIIIIKILAGIVIYISLGIAIFKTIRIITSKQITAFNVDVIDNKRLKNSYQNELKEVILAYINIIQGRRKVNELNANNLKYAIYALISLLISIAIYFSIYLKDL